MRAGKRLHGAVPSESESPEFMRLIDGGNRRSPTPRPRLTHARTPRAVNGDAVLKIIRGVPVTYYDATVVFADLRKR